MGVVALKCTGPSGNGDNVRWIFLATSLCMHMPELTLSNAIKMVQQPRLIPGAFNNLCLQANQYIHKQSQPDGVDVMTEDWDNLIILDACRYDIFKTNYSGNNRIERRWSKGSDSWGFIKANFVGRELHDTVYITANPFAAQIPKGTFHALINLLGEAWDNTAKTVQPEDVVAEAVTHAQKYQNKRVIVHFMQPHYPFLGPTGKSLSHAGLGEFDDQGERVTEHEDDGPTSVWGQLKFGIADFDEQDAWHAYQENLELVLPHAERLINTLNGKSVITSDHGNLIGERTTPLPVKGYGHPRNLFVPKLINVPWLVAEDERREVKSDPPEQRNMVDSKVVNNRLKHLGYI